MIVDNLYKQFTEFLIENRRVEFGQLSLGFNLIRLQILLKILYPRHWLEFLFVRS